MRNDSVLAHEFVEYIPETLDDGKLYVSIRFATVVHKCCCGCGMEVVTPLSPTDWKLTFDGKSISLYPSVGNWSLDCRSHYWITTTGLDGRAPGLRLRLMLEEPMIDRLGKVTMRTALNQSTLRVDESSRLHYARADYS